MSKSIILLITLLAGFNISSCQENKTIEDMKLAEVATASKSQKINLNPGEIFVSFITNRKPNTDELFQSYFTTVFPIALKHGAVPLGNLFYDKIATGNFQGTDFIGLSKWTNQEGAAAFGQEMPEDKLTELREPIWNDLKVFGVPITDRVSFTLKEGKTYEYKLVWGEKNDIKKSLKKISKGGGEILFNFPAAIYQDLKGNAAPHSFMLIEWESIEEADKHRKDALASIKEEAFYTHFTVQRELPADVKTNHFVQKMNTTPEAVWDVLKTGGEVDKWFPFITSCKLEGNGIGAKRICTTADGKTLEESITNIDYEHKIITYTIDKHNMEMPIHNIKGIMRVKEDNGKALMDWTVHFELQQEIDDEMLTQLQAGMVELMESGVNGIEELTKK